MELWENEVYRFKTIGQLKVGKRGGVSSLLCFIWTNFLFMVLYYSPVSGHQSVFAQRRSSSETGHLWNDLAWFSKNRLWGTLSLVVDEKKSHLSFCWTSTNERFVPLSVLSTQGFATLIREWPGELYNNNAIVQAVTDHLKKDPNNRTLLTTLAEL